MIFIPQTPLPFFPCSSRLSLLSVDRTGYNLIHNLYMYLSSLLSADHSFAVCGVHFVYFFVNVFVIHLFYCFFVFSVLLPTRDLCCPNTLVGLNGIQQIT